MYFGFSIAVTKLVTMTRTVPWHPNWTKKERLADIKFNMENYLNKPISKALWDKEGYPSKISWKMSPFLNSKNRDRFGSFTEWNLAHQAYKRRLWWIYKNPEDEEKIMSTKPKYIRQNANVGLVNKGFSRQWIDPAVIKEKERQARLKREVIRRARQFHKEGLALFG